MEVIVEVRSKCSVYVTTGPEGHNPKVAYGGDHITMAKCEKRNSKKLTGIMQDVAQKNLAGKCCDAQWHPKKGKWKISVWKGRYTMVITSKRLVEVAKQLEDAGVSHLMGPGNGKCKFHVTLPKSIRSSAEAKKYAKMLSKRDWSLTVVSKKKSGRVWSGYAPLKQKSHVRDINKDAKKHLSSLQKSVANLI